MSYCRVSTDSDVYVFYNTGDFYECCGCRFGGPSPMLRTATEMLEHLRKHQEAGHKVPQYAIDGLKEDAEEESAHGS